MVKFKIALTIWVGRKQMEIVQKQTNRNIRISITITIECWIIETGQTHTASHFKDFRLSTECIVLEAILFYHLKMSDANTRMQSVGK